MSIVQTVTGPIIAADMGRTLIHEHVTIAMPGWQFDPRSAKPSRADIIARSVDKLAQLHPHACKTIVDPCPMDVGRDVELIAEVSQRSGIQIVCATGVYTEAEGTAATFRAMPFEDILALFIKEITEGIGETGIKAGVVKIASGPDPANEYENRMIAIAAQAARLTGVPLISHTDLATHGHNQIDIVERHGGHARCMVVGHSGDRDDHAYQCSLAARGAFLGLDRFGIEMVLADDIRIKNLVELLVAGHRDQILVSHDHVLCLLGRLGPDVTAAFPNYNITRIFDDILPRLRAEGVTEGDIQTILVDNPRNLFTNAAQWTAREPVIRAPAFVTL